VQPDPAGYEEKIGLLKGEWVHRGCGRMGNGGTAGRDGAIGRVVRVGWNAHGQAGRLGLPDQPTTRRPCALRLYSVLCWA